MSSFLNKISNSISSNASMVLGREAASKLTNALNNVIYNAKYKELLKSGNIIQLVSKNAHMSLQICASPNDNNRLIVLGNGQIGPEFRNAHFTVIKLKNGHFKFQNAVNFFALDEPQGVPCILSEPTSKKPKPYEYIRARNEFRLHEVIGSEEWFALESVYFPGKYISITPDGSIGVLKDKSDQSTHFCVHLIYEDPVNVRPDRKSVRPVSSLSNISAVGAHGVAGSASNAEISSIASSSSGNAARSSYQSEESRLKQEESERYAAEQASLQPSAPVNNGYSPQDSDSTPPAYGNLFPTLPK